MPKLQATHGARTFLMRPIPAAVVAAVGLTVQRAHAPRDLYIALGVITDPRAPIRKVV